MPVPRGGTPPAPSGGPRTAGEPRRGAVEHPWPTLVLGYATQEQDETRALGLYDTAARGFVRTGDAEGEVLARHNLRNIQFRRGDAEAAGRQVALALSAAEASGQPLTMARAAVLEASHLVQTGGDVGRAYRALQRAQRLAFPDGPIGLRRSILTEPGQRQLLPGAPRRDDRHARAAPRAPAGGRLDCRCRDSGVQPPERPVDAAGAAASARRTRPTDRRRG